MIIYRTPGPQDVTALANLGRETFCETFAHLYKPEDLNVFLSDVYTPSVVAEDVADPTRIFQVAEEEGALVGYCKLGLVISLDYDPGDREVIELKQLYIRQTHQGAGVAHHLMEWALAEAKSHGADDILLSVWSENERAQRFYKKFGFEWVADTYFMVGNQRDEEYLFLRPM